MTERLLRRREVEKVTGKPRSSIYDDVVAGTFPAPIKIGAKAVAWLESEVMAWLDACVAERDAEQAKLTQEHHVAERDGGIAGEVA